MNKMVAEFEKFVEKMDERWFNRSSSALSGGRRLTKKTVQAVLFF